MPEEGSQGGPAACEPPFVAALRKTGVEVEEETYVFDARGDAPTFLERMKRVVKTARNLRRRLKTKYFDILHLNTSFDFRATLRDAMTLLLLRKTGSKIFLKFHGSDAELLSTNNPVRRLFGRFLLKRAHGIGLLSSEEKENFLRAGVEAKKIFVVKNAVEKKMPREVQPAFISNFKLKTETPKLLFISRFIPAKGLTDVIRACAILRERAFEFELICVGDGPARAEAEREVESNQLAAQVHFIGFIPEEETNDFYYGSTMLVFPTHHYEGFPMVIFHALAAGLPIITTRIRAAADYLSEPDNCLWTEPQNPQMLAEKMIYLLTHAEARKRMAENNPKLAERFSPETVAREYLEIYEKLIQAKDG